MTWLLTALGFARKALSALLDLARRYPLAAVCIALLCLSAWLWHGKGKAISERDAARATIVAMQEAAKQARAQSVTIAKDSDHEHEKRLADNRDRTSRYIASHRLQPACGVSTPAEGESAGPSEKPASVPQLVAVSEQDVKTCGDLQAYAQSAYEWAKKLRDRGLAD